MISIEERIDNYFHTHKFIGTAGYIILAAVIIVTSLAAVVTTIYKKNPERQLMPKPDLILKDHLINVLVKYKIPKLLFGGLCLFSLGYLILILSN